MGKPQQIGRSELEVLRYIQDHQPVTVREVADYFAQAKGHVRTTILNVMERLRKKGYLTRRRTAGVFQYAPSVPKTELQQDLVRDFVTRALGGSVSPFMAYLAQEAKISDDELRELKKLVRDLDQQQKEERS
jgi:predicted transcriptional regulator